MADINTEAQTAAENPPRSAETAHDTGQGATRASPNSPGASGTDSPTGQQTDQKKSPSFGDVLNTAKEALGKDLPEQGAEDEEAAERSAAGKTESGQAPAEPAAAKEEVAAGKPGAETQTDAAFDQRQEWKDLSAAMPKEAWDKSRPIVRKLMERESALNTQLTQARPDLDAVTELKTLAGDPKGFEFMRGVVRMFASSDPKGIPIMEAMLAQLRERNGMVVKSPDVKARLDKGEIDEAAALEIEKARAGQARTEQQLEAQRQREQQNQAETASRAMSTAMDDWEKGIREKDLDFGKLTDDSDPQHGMSKADQVMAEITAMLQARPAKTNAELVAAAQKAYETVNRRIAAYRPAPRPLKPISSETSSRTAKAKPQGFKETVESATSILYGSAT